VKGLEFGTSCLKFQSIGKAIGIFRSLRKNGRGNSGAAASLRGAARGGGA
jgi:hypothetical protein